MTALQAARLRLAKYVKAGAHWWIPPHVTDLTRSNAPRHQTDAIQLRRMIDEVVQAARLHDASAPF